MQDSLFSRFRKIVEQAWLPIFVDDSLDTEMLIEACRLAGLGTVEYTLRRKDAAEIIKSLKEKLPRTVVLMGSTIDSDDIINERRRIYPQLMTLSELAPYVDGFVSMLPYSDETLEEYSETHICIPTAETSGEALRQIKSGAAVIKVLGPDFSFSKRLHALPTHNYCSTYVTGGVTVERMDEVFAAGNILCASGFDVVLRGIDPETLTAELIAEKLCEFTSAARAARDKVLPELKGCEGLSDEDFRAALPNYCGIR